MPQDRRREVVTRTAARWPAVVPAHPAPARAPGARDPVTRTSGSGGRGHAGTARRATSVALVGTFPPTVCGLATYTANLAGAIASTGTRTGVVRLVDGAGGDCAAGTVDPSVAGVWNRLEPDGYVGAAALANRFDAVLLQHEFGIYPGPDGLDVVPFLAACGRPVITTMHTVLDQPTEQQRFVVDELLLRSQLVVVHSEVAHARLLGTHATDPGRVAIVPHGAALNLDGPPLVTAPIPIALTWGLLGPGKGIEHAIGAVARLRTSGIEVRYIVAGETHPNVLAAEGERYRDGLAALATELGVADLVTFDATYRDWESLRALVRSATVVVLPYDSHDQVTSGVLVEAIASGRPVVATAFPHAVELSRTGAVVLVRHGAVDRLARALAQIVSEPGVHDAMAIAARSEARRYDWDVIGRRYRDLAEYEVVSDRRITALAGW